MISLIFLLALQADPAPSPEATDQPQRKLSINLEIDADFIKTHDKDGNTSLSLIEFQDAMMQRVEDAIAQNPEAKAKMSPEKIMEFREKVIPPMFRSLDKNTDGQLSADELTNQDTEN